MIHIMYHVQWMHSDYFLCELLRCFQLLHCCLVYEKCAYTILYYVLYYSCFKFAYVTPLCIIWHTFGELVRQWCLAHTIPTSCKRHMHTFALLKHILYWIDTQNIQVGPRVEYREQIAGRMFVSKNSKWFFFILLSTRAYTTKCNTSTKSMEKL